MRQCYVAGSYSSPTEDGTRAHIRAALFCAYALTTSGWHPIVPHVMGLHEASWGTAMVRCRDLIRGLDPQRDVLVTMPGWQASRGAVEEVELARSLGVRVMTFFEAIQ